MTRPSLSEEEIFQVARRIETPEARLIYLWQVCGDNTELLKKVQALLAAHDLSDDFMESPHSAIAAGSPPTIAQPASERPGAHIGPYKLLQQIGEGGFGVVFMAEQLEPVRRKVALKVIKPGMDTRQVIARFEAERQALAVMDHPNIARVLDAGATESGRPYFVMELVRGIPITQYCDESSLPIRERLELFATVCQAIQHAHTKGIIHRDIKPTNVMVTRQDGQPVVKVIDFGVAKAMGQALTDKTLFTEFAQMIGTPLYMSPEQAELSSVDIDTRSDIYSLGVLLYELLTGTTPVSKEQLKQAAFDEIRRIIREDEPQKPSTRISTAESAPSIAAQRHTEPAKLARLVRGELDWIAMKALEKDRGRRYETASGLAADVQRYLNDEQVQACPPSAWYRFRKFARRNKTALVAASLVALALVVGTLVSAWQAIRATNAEERALVQAAKAQTISGLLQEMLASAHPDKLKGTDYTLRELLDEFSERLDKLKEQPEVEATIRLIMGTAYWRLAVLDKSEHHLTRALALRRQVFGDEHEQVAEVLVEYAWTLRDMGDNEEALARAREALAIYRQRGVGGRPLIKAMWSVQDFLSVQGKHPESDALGREALAIARESPDGEYPDVANITHELAFSTLAQGHAKEAEQLARQALTLHLRVHGKAHHETGWGMCALGMALQAQGKYAEAAAHLREALAIFRKDNRYGHYNHRFAFDNLVLVLQALGEEKELEELRRVRLADTAKGVEGRPEDPQAWFQRGLAHAELQQQQEAMVDFQQTISLSEQLATRFPGKREYHVLQANAHNELANSHAALGRHAEAETLYEKALVLRKATLGADHKDTLWTMHMLANTYASLGRHTEAVKLGEETLALQRVNLGVGHGDTLWSMHMLANNYEKLGQHDEALKTRQEALKLTSAKVGPDHPDTLYSMQQVAISLIALRQNDEALKLLQETLALRRDKLGPDHTDTFWTMAAVAERLVILGRGAEAVPLIDECVQKAGDKPIRVSMVPSLILMRLQHFRKSMDVAGVRGTAEMWEKLNRSDANSLYNAACMRAVTAAILKVDPKTAGADATKLANEEADRAMAWLHKAIAAGYKDAGHMVKDTDLDALRGREDFKKVLAELEGKMK